MKATKIAGYCHGIYLYDLGSAHGKQELSFTEFKFFLCQHLVQFPGSHIYAITNSNQTCERRHLRKLGFEESCPAGMNATVLYHSVGRKKLLSHLCGDVPKTPVHWKKSKQSVRNVTLRPKQWARFHLSSEDRSTNGTIGYILMNDAYQGKIIAYNPLNCALFTFNYNHFVTLPDTTRKIL